MKRLRIRGWRVVHCEGGVFVFIDPRRERLELFDGPWPDLPAVPHFDREEVEVHGYTQAMLWDATEEGDHTEK